jgi:hypothetical protein
MLIIWILLSIWHSSEQLERWSAMARSFPPDDLLFRSIKILLETTDEGNIQILPKNCPEAI